MSVSKTNVSLCFCLLTGSVLFYPGQLVPRVIVLVGRFCKIPLYCVPTVGGPTPFFALIEVTKGGEKKGKQGVF